jgi:hypothetical protein
MDKQDSQDRFCVRCHRRFARGEKGAGCALPFNPSAVNFFRVLRVFRGCTSVKRLSSIVSVQPNHDRTTHIRPRIHAAIRFKAVWLRCAESASQAIETIALLFRIG